MKGVERIFKDLFCYFYLYVLVCGHEPMSAGSHRGQRCQDAVVLKLRAPVRCSVWVLGIKLGSSTRALCTLNHRAISSALKEELFGGGGVRNGIMGLL